jgi:L-amino acid N-acyltransferase YncA
MIRNATHEDVPKLVELAKAMHADSKFNHFNFYPTKLDALMHALVDSEDGFALVAEKAGVVIGGFIGYITTHFFGTDRTACDYGTFVRKTERGGAGSLLIAEYVKQAKQRGVAEIVIANSTGMDLNKVAKAFERAGFSHDGHVYSMRVTV